MRNTYGVPKKMFSPHDFVCFACHTDGARRVGFYSLPRRDRLNIINDARRGHFFVDQRSGKLVTDGAPFVHRNRISILRACTAVLSSPRSAKANGPTFLRRKAHRYTNAPRG